MASVHFLYHRLHCGGDVDEDITGRSNATGGKASFCLVSVSFLFLDSPTLPTLEIGLRLCLVTNVEHQVHLAGVM